MKGTNQRPDTFFTIKMLNGKIRKAGHFSKTINVSLPGRCIAAPLIYTGVV